MVLPRLWRIAKFYYRVDLLPHFPYTTEVNPHRYGGFHFKKLIPKARINHQIRAPELRVITDEGETLGVLSFREAMEAALSRGMDLIEISPNAVPPVAKIMDYGKFQYQQNKKQKEIKAKSHVTETKAVQIKAGTSEHDLGLKAKNVSKWLAEGHRVKIDLYLVGRMKYSDMNFKKERLERILNLISENYKVASGPEKGPKGLTMTIERAGKGSGTPQQNPPQKTEPKTNENQ